MITHRRHATTVAFSAAASRVATVALMMLANELLPTHNAAGVHKFRPDTFPVPAGPGVGGTLAAFTRWDAAWFLSIADSGYPSVQDDERDDFVKRVDCAGTRRAWGGDGYKRRQEDQQEEHEAEGRPLELCREDVPLDEQAHAFFPLYPWLVRCGAAALRNVLPAAAAGAAIGEEAQHLVLAAVLISNALFVAAAVLLYHLGAVVTGDALLAFRGALAFCATPASVFFSTAYSESLFAALTFAGLLVLFSKGHTRRTRTYYVIDDHGGVRDQSASGGARGNNVFRVDLNAWIAALCLSLATLTRSNGIAGAGVLVLEKLRWMTQDAGIFSTSEHEPCESGKASTSSIASTSSNEGDREIGGDTVKKRIPWRDTALPWVRLVACAIATLLQALLVVAPYVLVQAYAYRKFCVGKGGGGRTEHLASIHPWCSWLAPSVYAYVQSAYWGVGALKYYRWKQIPNFLLAAPTLILTASGCVRFFSGHVAPARRLVEVRGRQAGSGPIRKWASCPAWLERMAEVFCGPPGLPSPVSQPFERSGAAALVLQWGFLGILAAFFMNVQVATRFLAAACPPLHWWTASVLGRASGVDDRNPTGSGAVGTSVRWYLALYFVVGAVLHANFLPWT